MADSFTMFGKVGDALVGLPDDTRRAIIVAIAEYGLYGSEPSFGDGLEAAYCTALFEAFREDVDNSKNQRAKGARGGRPPADAQQVKTTSAQAVKTTGAKQVKTTSAQAVKTTGAKQVKTTSAQAVKTTGAKQVKTTSAQAVKTTGDDNAKPKPDQTIPIHTSPDQAKPGRDGAPATAPGDDDTEPFTPPTPEEVEAYARASTMPSFSAEEFVDHYSTVGWVMPNGRPVRDWHALARSWARRQPEFDRRDAADAHGGRLTADDFAEYR